MGRKRAIAQLTKIYETTHPLVDEAKTPTRERVWETISALDKAKPRKRPAAVQPSDPNAAKQQRETKTLETMTADVLAWFRQPQNERIYLDCLAMKAINLVGLEIYF
jgi:hypothetical protein